MAQRRLLAVAAVMALLSMLVVMVTGQAVAEPGCQQALVVFARGSGQTFEDPSTSNRDAVTFFNAIKKNLPAAAVANVDLGNLDGNGVISDGEYPATGLAGWFGVDLRELFDPEDDAALAGYNKSRHTGTDELVRFLNGRNCPNETVILGGYSQGAHVVGTALPLLSSSAASRVGYVALFGDPKFSAGGFFGSGVGHRGPWARGNFDWWDGPGILGARDPYLPPSFINKTGSWCDKDDGICTGALRGDAHGKYPDDEILNAANIIAVKLRSIRPDLRDEIVTTPLPIDLRPVENVDVAFVVDTTGSMYDDIDAAKQSINQVTEALFGVAESARVCLVDYKDDGDAYQARVDMPFTTDRTAFAGAVNDLTADGGGDTPESVYSGLMTAYGLDWRPGALKLAIPIGDAPAKNPEPVTGYTLEQVLRTSFELDPVVINPILVGGDSAARTSFTELADGSTGQVFDAANAAELVAAIEAAVTSFSLAPVAQAGGPYTAEPGDEILFTGAGSFDPNGAILEYAWDFNDDSVADITSDSPVVTHTYDAPYQGLASLTVTGDDGRTNKATAEVNVAAGQHRPLAPSAPRAVTAEVTGTDEVGLTWQPPSNDGDGPVTGYRISREDGVHLSVVPADANSFTILRVPTDRDVRFSVAAVNEFGASKPALSNTVRVGTAPTIPPTSGPPASTSQPPSSSPSGQGRASGGLPDTGANVLPLIGLALALVLAGTAVVALARRRRRSS